MAGWFNYPAILIYSWCKPPQNRVKKAFLSVENNRARQGNFFCFA